ncbi:hypothetical protein D3C80_194350 [compost metagenome]
MRANELISSLEGASGPNRFIDTQMAILIGFKKFRPVPDSNAVWHSPDGIVTNIPHFTRSIHEAKLFAEMVLPGHVGAVTWGREPTAQINNSGICEGATSPIALCRAALLAGLQARAIR